MSFRHLRLNNNNEHFIYYPPSYLMINYFPKDSFSTLFELQLILLLVFSLSYVLCALEHLVLLSNAYIYTSILSRIDNAKFCSNVGYAVVVVVAVAMYYLVRIEFRYISSIYCRFRFFVFCFFNIHLFRIILSNELILFFTKAIIVVYTYSIINQITQPKMKTVKIFSFVPTECNVCSHTSLLYTLRGCFDCPRKMRKFMLPRCRDLLHTNQSYKWYVEFSCCKK